MQKSCVEIMISPNNGIKCSYTKMSLKCMKLKDKDLFFHSMMVGLIAEQIAISIGLVSRHYRSSKDRRLLT